MAERGIVKWFNNRQGWGFIARAGRPDVYVRHDRICGEGFKELHAGDRVEFVLRKGARGPYAADVVRVNALPPEMAEDTESAADQCRDHQTRSNRRMA